MLLFPLPLHFDTVYRRRMLRRLSFSTNGINRGSLLRIPSVVRN